MGCCHHYFAPTAEGDSAFTIDASTLTFGPGCLKEAGDQARALGMTRVGLYTDAGVRKLPHIETVTRSLAAAHVDYAIYDAVKVEPTDASF
jgi:hydroxyacid-oxoacid transhydrogenase